MRKKRTNARGAQAPTKKERNQKQAKQEHIKSIKRVGPAGIFLTLTLIGTVTGTLFSLARTTEILTSRSTLISNASELFTAFQEFYQEHGYYPPGSPDLEGGFDVRSLEPLSSEGFVYNAREITDDLESRRIAFYDSYRYDNSDDGFWAILVDRTHRSSIVLIADTSNYPGAPGTHLFGTYLVRQGRLEKRGGPR